MNKDLQTEFEQFIRTERLFTRQQRLLVAVSGGVDSVVLAHLCRALEFDIELAHCNFQLRGAESMRDEEFSVQFAGMLGVPIAVKRFDTEAYAAAQKLSIQEAARELRYHWFEELMNEKGFFKLLTGHHADDNVETMLMNLFKGTGIAGLRGMLPLNARLARPLLFAEKNQIDAYARQHGLGYVEDSSNLSDKYSRNYFRLNLIPLAEKIMPGAVDHLREDIARYREVEVLYREAVDKRLKKLLVTKGAEVHIPVNKLKLMVPLRTLTFEIFSAFGFTTGQLDGIVKLMDSETGRFMESATHRLLLNRNWFILSPLSIEDASIYIIQDGQGELNFPGHKLLIREEGVSPGYLPPSDPQVAQLDADLIQYPLVLRRWKEGDYFYPLGMQKKKKLARFLIDRKLSKIDKEGVYVLESAGRIVWVVGQRIDDRAKIRTSTSKVLTIKCSKN